MRRKAALKYNTEAELAKDVVAYLTQQGWDVYQEVESVRGVADIVAVKDGKLLIVETKRNMCLDVLYQAHRWRMYADYVVAAVGRSLKSDVADFGRYVVAEAIKVDVWCFTPGYTRDITSLKHEEPRKVNTVFEALRPEHKVYAQAGSARGGHWTPFKTTCETLHALILSNPQGMTINEVLDVTGPLHYKTKASAKSSLTKWIERGKVPNLKFSVDKIVLK
jgi:hypothetical protein